VANEEAYQRKLSETRELLKPHMKVLEFGCGTGTTALYHSKFVAHITAIDISSKMIEIAQSKADADGIQNIKFLQSDAEHLKENEAAFDVVMGHSILHLLEDKEATIDRVFQLIKPGGYFVSSTACLANMSKVWKLLLPLGYKLGLLPMVKFFEQEHLEGCITNTGFNIVTSWRPNPNSGVFIIARKPE
jgi:ubiquinone/menaquinone biosynthesis C-methylase UbiE